MIYDDLTPCYLLAQKVSEAEHFRAGTISYGLSSLILEIEKYYFSKTSDFREGL
jgi:hypothetical protein